MSEEKQLTGHSENNNHQKSGANPKLHPYSIHINLIDNEVVVYNDKNNFVGKIDTNKQ